MRILMITIRLRMDTPGGVTSPEDIDNVPSARTDDNVLPIRTDTRHHPHLPGTTVAGSLRALWEQEFGTANDLFGHIENTDDTTPDQSSGSVRKPTRFPSKIQVLGTRHLGASSLQPSDSASEEQQSAPKPTLVHRRTAIDRRRGGPLNHALHGVEMLPAGTEFDVVLRWNEPDPPQREQFLETVASWHPRLGRDTALDAGRCRVIALGSRDYDLTTPQGLHDWLRIDRDSDNYPEPTQEIAAPQLRDLKFECRIVDGLHCGTGEAIAPPAGKSKVNRVVRRDGNYIVPASTLKGVLRSRAEYICHAVSARVCDDQSCGQCTPCKIFGHSKKVDANSSGDDGFPAKRAKIAIRDAIIKDPKRSERQHVAIDRFTGGSRDQLLYTDEVLVQGRFHIQIHEFDSLLHHERRLIEAVLTDLHDGLIGIGARTSSGFGTVRVTAPDYGVAENKPDLSSLAHLLAPEPTS